jgi:hypothetical protein
MKRSFAILFGSVLFLGAGTAAQAQNPYARPAVSPYTNLFRPGQPVGLNYYNLVRPDLDFRSSIQQLQQQNQAQQQAINDLQAPAGPVVTGHQAGFQTHRAYFQTVATGPISGTGAAGVGAGGRGARR